MTIRINIWTALLTTVIASGAVAGGVALADRDQPVELPAWSFEVGLDDPLTDAEKVTIADAVAAAGSDDDRVAIAWDAADHAFAQGRRLLVVVPLEDHEQWAWQLTWERGTTAADGSLYETLDEAVSAAGDEARRGEFRGQVTDVVVVNAA